MAVGATDPDTLLVAARDGDETAYGRLVDLYRPELHAHCYRMTGSVHDADDALQDALLRAWKGLPRFEGRSSLRSWFYRIATNTSLDVIGRRPKRVLPIDFGPATDPHDGPGMPLPESVWVEPYPDEQLGLQDGFAGPEARYELRESVELAFVAALQHLPARQRAVLILREVLGYSAKEVADELDTTVASVNSALQRARATLDQKLPERSQQATLRSLADDELKGLVDRYVAAWERNDVDAVVELLTEDAAISMPPLASWFGGRAPSSASSSSARRCPASSTGARSARPRTGSPRSPTTTWTRSPAPTSRSRSTCSRCATDGSPTSWPSSSARSTCPTSRRSITGRTTRPTRSGCGPSSSASGCPSRSPPPSPTDEFRRGRRS